MIPVLVGAAVCAAGAALLGGNDKPKQPLKEKQQVSENYVMQQLARAGKNFQGGSASGMKFIPSDDFSADFAKIENMLASPNVKDEFISAALNAIEQQAQRQWSDRALNLVADYREKLQKRHGSVSGMGFIPSDDFSADFARIENMLVNLNISYVSIKNELESIKLKAKRRNDDNALNFVAYYREKLRKRRR